MPWPKGKPRPLTKTAWKPGKSGNPAGRPRGPAFADIVRKGDPRRFAERIMYLCLTGDGEPGVVAKAMEIASSRLWPLKYLHEVSGAVEMQHSEVLGALTNEELRVLEGILEARQQRAAATTNGSGNGSATTH